jgi:hypothetical protein
MSKKYIKQIDSQNFVYPNNNLAEYDIEIIHEINNNPISGSVVSLSAVTATSSSITFDLDYTWVANGAELYVNPSGNTNLVAVYMMAPNQEYFKPFRCVGYATTGSTGSSITSLLTFSVTPADMGLTIFENGTYQFEVRFIGRKSVLPICTSVVVSSIVGPTPTPTVTPTITATPTATPVTPTPTATPTSTPVQYQSGATLNVTDTGWIKYTDINGITQYVFISSTGTYTLNDCALCSSIIPGFPFGDVASFTVTNCGTNCGTPSVTPTPTPTVTPSQGGSYDYYTIDIYSCFPCNFIGTGIARSTSTLTIGNFYTIADGNAYYVTNTATGPSYDVDLSGSVSGPSCNYVCSI